MEIAAGFVILAFVGIGYYVITSHRRGSGGSGRDRGREQSSK